MRRLLLLAIVAAAVASPTRAQPPAPDVLDGRNLIVNGDGERGAAVRRVSDAPAPPPGWSVTGPFSQVAYGAGDFPDAADSRSVDGGVHFLAGGPGDPNVASASQTIDVSSAADAIDARGVYARLKADIGGFGQQRDYGTVDATFTSDKGETLARMRIGPVTVDDRGGLPIGDFQGYGHTKLTPRDGLRHVPAHTRSITVKLTSVRQQGTFGDGYFDNVELSLVRRPAARPPRATQTFGARTLRGRVLVRTPGAKRTRVLGRRSELLPVRTFVDARRGAVRIESAANAFGALQRGRFEGARFVVEQPSAARPYTVLTLRERPPATCGTDAARAARRKRLFGRARGRFRSRANGSSATSRGTTWWMEETCAGTATAVVEGKIDIHDYARDELIPIARGVEPDESSHDPRPPPPCPPGLTCAEPPPPAAAPSPRRRAGSRYVAGGRRR